MNIVNHALKVNLTVILQALKNELLAYKNSTYYIYGAPNTNPIQVGCIYNLYKLTTPTHMPLSVFNNCKCLAQTVTTLACNVMLFIPTKAAIHFDEWEWSYSEPFPILTII